MKLKEFISKELKGWKPIEVVWLVFCTVTVLAISIYYKDTLFIFGTVNVVFYSYT